MTTIIIQKYIFLNVASWAWLSYDLESKLKVEACFDRFRGNINKLPLETAPRFSFSRVGAVPFYFVAKVWILLFVLFFVVAFLGKSHITSHLGFQFK